MHRAAIVAFIVLLLGAAYGCWNSVQREYVWTRQDKTLEGKPDPTTFVIRLNVDPPTKSVVWFEDAYDHDRNYPRTTMTWNDCTFLDSDNWQCEIGVVLGVRIQNDIEMKDGKLHQQYYSEDRQFVLRRKLFGVSF